MLRTFIFFLTCWLTFVASNAEEITFRRITPPGGLSFQGIRDIDKDKSGTVWVSSEHGLFRFDSENFRHYRHIKGQEGSLPDNDLTKIKVDRNGKLWIGTDCGLVVYDHTTDKFETKFKCLIPEDVWKWESRIIKALEEDHKGQLWVIFNFRLFKINADRSSCEEVYVDNIEALSCLFFDQTGTGWIGTKSGAIFSFDPDTKEFEKISDGKGHELRTIYAKGQHLYAGYISDGVSKLTRQGKVVKHYTYPQSKQWDIDKASIRAITSDHQGRMWFGTFQGLYVEENGELTRYSPDSAPGLTHNSIRCFYIDNENGIWIGTWAGGISYSHPADNNITTYWNNGKKGALNNNIISSFAQFDDKGIYVGTEVGGINYLDFSTHKFRHIPLSENTPMAINIKSLRAGPEGSLYAGTLNGLFIRKNKGDKFKHFTEGPSDGLHLPGKAVYDVYPVDSGAWVVVFGKSVCFYNKKTERISYWKDLFPKLKLRNKAVRHLMRGSKGNLWISSRNGVYRINPKDPESFTLFADPDYKSSNYFCSFETSAGLVLFATKSSGVIVYDPDSESLVENDLSKSIYGFEVYAITEDNHKHLWFSTNQGILRYNPERKKLRHLTETDGLQGNIFNPQAVFKDRSGKLYFGGTNGFNVIDPKALKINTRPPQIIFNRILINNKSERNYFSLLNKEGQASLNLAHDENSLRLDFSADNYLLSPKNKFRYRLLGLSNEWIDGQTEGTAVFTNLSDGSYTFEVLACNNDGIFSDSPARIFIDVAVPTWRSANAFILYTILFSIICFLIFRSVKDRQKLKKQMLINAIEHKNKEDLHELKLRFFTNISHEFRTPLTLITSPVKRLLEDTSLTPKSKEYLMVIDRNTKRLLGLVDQILDLRKSEKGKNLLEVANINLREFVYERYLGFEQSAKDKNIRYEFQDETPKVTVVEADAEKLDKIVYNLLSNAFKHISEGDNITVTVAKTPSKSGKKYANQLRFGQVDTKDLVEITVSDTGKGIASQDLIRIFNRFEQGENRSDGSGIGLSICQEYTFLHRGDITAKSSPGKGSSFRIRIPRLQAAQKILGDSPADNAINTTETKIQDSIPEAQLRSTLLIVEDNNDLQFYLNDLLSDKHNILLASDGKQALKLLSTHEVDLVVSDIMMPEMDGMELCENIKSNLETSHIPVLLLTALSDSENKMTGYRYGADAYLAKPFDNEFLLVRIGNLLKQARRLKESFGTPETQPESQEGISDIDNQFVRKINSLVSENMIKEDFSIEWLASEAGLSRSQLHRKLKGMTGNSPSEYVRIIKLKKAAELLSEGEMNIDEVAFVTGFPSHSYFSKCFKNLYKVSPKEFRNKKIEQTI
ncbi:hybrid sensor histidine kinase/response regulator (plasmid) [Fulvitalea axinellae]|uniref:histidine kinase n=1 Tax=Fulvitalea axinellae TaxID=1182444 RepID=A0AAU9CW44_9BACT|nr:hybrid sensor histidine kinase/response regulator [Fulvitalea axinellae]